MIDLKKCSFTVCLVLVIFCMSALAQEKPAPEKGFVSIFNGADLTGWDGDPRLWSVVDGVLRGQTTKENPTEGNSFCVWRGGKTTNFVLKAKFLLHSGNSGIQYRSAEPEKWRIKGYQADILDRPGLAGFLYEEGRRGWLVNVGDIMVIDKDAKKNVVGKISDVEQLKKAGYYNVKGWNELTITCRGNHIMQEMNGYPTMELIDEDPKDRSMEGLLALQIHAGPPMMIDFKDIRIKQLPDHFEETTRLFNGADLDEWTFSSDQNKTAWSVKDGILKNEGKPGGFIYTKKDYTNYILRLQWRHLGKGNGGVLLRAVEPFKVWPRSIEAQGQYNAAGDIWNIDKFPMKTAAERTNGRHTKKAHDSNEKPAGQGWNQYEIKMDGPNLELIVNNLLQNTATECWQTPGKICLQSEGSKMEFRNIILIPIKK